ncbi:predicted protein [Phaeodactylum tricornutum CCAP 1055/1]|uniref:RNA polymerase sigma-70 region 2 domain-containing protein n=1 Tax=Phaeodactylum tricornutum (strain CCAP 1055/1) TaxID=556484 RepID=B7GD81_PHATC|nr:predicted protein [Phaeodactylum tricornutum CCAP 1055/1]EEC43530.1 predicted protein [Phaeodactylum tricornutum CCAP 1055/1]|eukprot:XP_002185083.1 predicted protein [Phaeodactylum tricornutum CCAP 1055/1]
MALPSRRTSRKRLRVVVLGILCASNGQGVLGFLSIGSKSSLRYLTTPPPSRSGSVSLFAISSSQRRTTTNKGSATDATPQFLPRITHEEMMTLLSHTVELRRIKQIEADLALTYPSSRKPTTLAVARKAGYADDLEAYEATIDLGYASRETMVTRNMGLVHFCANDIVGTQARPSRLQTLSREDLIQEGAIGLARAVDRWNPEIGGKFSTYAVYWVRAAILRCIAERDDLVRVPEHVSAAVRKISRAARQLGIDIDGNDLISSVYSKDASWKEAQAAKALAEEAGLTPRQVSEAIKVKARRRGGMLSFEAWMQQGQDFATDLTPVVADDNPLASLETEQLKSTLSKFLRPKEMEALSWRYGLQRDYVAEAEEELFGRSPRAPITVKGRWGEAMSFTEVGKKMKVSAEYGRRLCHKALNKLRVAAEEGMLEPALLL